jgi:chromosome segregation ATPase
MTDIVERLRADIESLRGLNNQLLADCAKAETEIERLTAEVEEWKERWAAERRDHEATIRRFDTLMNEVP